MFFIIKIEKTRARTVNLSFQEAAKDVYNSRIPYIQWGKKMIVLKKKKEASHNAANPLNFPLMHVKHECLH